MTRRATAVVAALRASLEDRFFPRPIRTVDALERFVGSRAAHVAQTSLYGYLKTRMGTRYPEHFADPVFAAAIRAAAVRLFCSCAADLTIYAVAAAGAQGRLDAGASGALARRCFGGALAAGLGTADEPPPLDATALFAERAERTLWPGAVRGLDAFAGSAEDLIRLAPVTEAFKALDGDIVRNSIRFRWLDVLRQANRRLDGAAVSADWQAQAQGCAQGPSINGW